MKRFVEGTDRGQSTLFPECLEDWIDENNPIQAIDVFVEELDLVELGFKDVEPAATGRPGYHPAPLLKLYIYGYLNWVHANISAPDINGTPPSPAPSPRVAGSSS
jgi:transposase